jgi:hypothetical protein
VSLPLPRIGGVVLVAGLARTPHASLIFKLKFIIFNLKFTIFHLHSITSVAAVARAVAALVLCGGGGDGVGADGPALWLLRQRRQHLQ